MDLLTELNSSVEIKCHIDQVCVVCMKDAVPVQNSLGLRSTEWYLLTDNRCLGVLQFSNCAEDARINSLSVVQLDSTPKTKLCSLNLIMLNQLGMSPGDTLTIGKSKGNNFWIIGTGQSSDWRCDVVQCCVLIS